MRRAGRLAGSRGPRTGALAAGLDAHGDGTAFVVTGAGAERVGAIAQAAGIAPSELAMQESTLEDAFLEMTEGARR